MKSVDIGVLPNSICFSFTPPDIARQLYFYPTWCGHYFCSSRYYMKRNSYPPLLVIYVRRGILNVEYRGEKRQAREGDVVLLDCTEPHYYHAENNLEFLYMHYEGSNAHEITQHIINLHGWLFRREDRDEEGRFVRDSRNERVNILLQDMVYLYEHNHAEMFVTVWLGILEISTGILTAASAGHEYPMLKKADGNFELFKDRHGLPVGAMAGVPYKDYELHLTPGSRLFVYTDGVPEAINTREEMFGTERTLRALNGNVDAEPSELLRNVSNAMKVFTEDTEQFDDTTMLVLDYRGTENSNSKQ